MDITPLKQLEEQIKYLTEKIAFLENLSKCFFCQNIRLLRICCYCDNRMCNECVITRETKSYTSENINIHYCKQCK